MNPVIDSVLMGLIVAVAAWVVFKKLVPTLKRGAKPKGHCGQCDRCGH